MIRLKRMGVGGTSLFKAQTFEFKDGISYVYGLNHTSRTKGNSNASGKSFFFGQLPEMLYDVPVIGLKPDRTKKGKRFVEFTVGDREVKIMSSFSTAGREKITIWVDGEQKTYNTPTKGKQAIAQVFRPSAEDFNTYVYVDSRVPHPLVRGSSTERRNFFTRFFGLNRIDAERKLFANELAELMRTKKAHEELAKTYASLQADQLSKSEGRRLVQERDSLLERIEALQARAARAAEVRSLCDFAESAKKQLDRLVDYCGGAVTAETFAEALKDARWNVKNDAADLKDARAWEQYKRDVAAYKEATAKVQGSRNADDHKEAAELYDRLRPKYQVAKERLADLEEVKKPKRMDAPTGDLDALITQRAAIKASLERNAKFGRGCCPTCGQDVKVEDPAVLKRKLAKVCVAIEAFQEYAEYEASVREYSSYAMRKQELEATVASLTKKLRASKASHADYQILRGLRKPEAFAGKKLEVAVKERMLEDSRVKVQLLEFFEPHLDTVLAYFALTEKQLRLREFDISALQALQDKLDSIRLKLAVHRKAAKQAEEIQTRLQAMEQDLQKIAPLKLLIQGYADKTMKKMAIEAICQRLMGLVNHYAAPYFSGFTFEFLWGTQLSIIAHRPNGEASDVRKLSGAESLMFTLVLLMSLSAFVPQRRKVSTLILDEPSSSFSKETTRLFHEILPDLNRIFPSIVIITPKTEEQYPNAHTYTVVRTKGGATIEEGIHVN